jgi:hypothetical protein
VYEQFLYNNVDKEEKSDSDHPYHLMDHLLIKLFEENTKLNIFYKYYSNISTY